jgi:uncharacterized protein YcaQ
MKTIDDVRRAAVAWSLRPATTAAEAVTSMGFVQYDPIRAPARAQDLILAQRVEGHRVGDLDRAFESEPGGSAVDRAFEAEQNSSAVELEEDDLHVYGVMPATVASWLRPRCDDAGRPIRFRTTALERRVLALVQERGRLHPSEARAVLGTKQTTNAWGGTSATTTKALERLHHHGLVRVSHRRNGTRVYEPAPPRVDATTPDERLRRCVLLLADLLAPVPDRTLREVITQLRRNSRGVPRRPTIVDDLVATGELERAEIDGHAYLWPVEPFVAGRPAPHDAPDDDRVRFLAPFDPVVWDRRRFEHLWGWPYRFEAYTPRAKRRFGYYALPLLWHGRVIGWVNATSAPPAGPLDVVAGYVDGQPPRARTFRRAFDDEVDRLHALVRSRDPAETTAPEP